MFLIFAGVKLLALSSAGLIQIASDATHENEKTGRTRMKKSLKQEICQLGSKHQKMRFNEDHSGWVTSLIIDALRLGLGARLVWPLPVLREISLALGISLDLQHGEAS